jgi:hypothetical protein
VRAAVKRLVILPENKDFGWLERPSTDPQVTG